ncbi:HicB family protein [Spirochaetia bacterium]|nr:HicB family protein [Spirochaetia bacterium]
MKQYIAFISTDSPSPSVVFPDFSGCVSAGKNFEDAIRMAHEALSGHVECMKDAHLPIPEPSSMDEIKKNWGDWKDWKDSEYTTALIALVPGHETRKYTISMDSSLMARIDAVTNNRSAFFEKAAQEFLGSQAGAVL